MRRIQAAVIPLLFAATLASAAGLPSAPRASGQAGPTRAGSDVPGSTMPPSPEAQALTQTAVDDDAITRKAAEAIHADPRLADTDISVNTEHGIVNLTGSVHSREQAAIASARAQSPDGVMRIDDHLSVTP